MEDTLYKAPFVAELFNRMSPSYELMNAITSFGFYPLWRKQTIRQIRIKKGDRVADLLTGPGESWKHILPRIGADGTLTALDFSEGMISLAHKRKSLYPQYRIHLLQENILHSSIPSHSQDVVICCYGLKTFNTEQLDLLAKEIMRILKPGGTYSLVEVAMPETAWLKYCYRFYLGKVIPFISRLFVKDPETYNYLEIYSNRFNGFESMESFLRKYEGSPLVKPLFFGCAKGISGKKL